MFDELNQSTLKKRVFVFLDPRPLSSVPRPSAPISSALDPKILQD